MSRFESPGQVLLLFVGAAFVSVILIALLNAEAESRKHKEPEIENETLFTTLGRKLALLAQRWRHSEEQQVIMSRKSLQSTVTAAAVNEEPHPV